MFEYYKKDNSYFKISTMSKFFYQINCSLIEYGIILNYNAHVYDLILSHIDQLSPSTEEEFENKKAEVENAL